MSLIPLIFRDFYPEFRRPHRLLDQPFGVSLNLDNLLSSEKHHYRGRLCPWRSGQETGSTILNDKNKFQVSIDVQQFSPNEITVKTTDDNQIVVEGKHEEKQDEHGFVMRHFIRRYTVSNDHDVKDAFSNLSSDGVLTVIVPKKELPESKERIIPITQTGPVKVVTDKCEKEE